MAFSMGPGNRSGQAESLTALCKKMHPSFDRGVSRGSLAQPSQLCARDSRNRPLQRASAWTMALTKARRNACTLKSVARHSRVHGDLSRLRSCSFVWPGAIRGSDSSARPCRVWLWIHGRTRAAATKPLFFSPNSQQNNGLASVHLPGTRGNVNLRTPPRRPVKWRIWTDCVSRLSRDVARRPILSAGIVADESPYSHRDVSKITRRKTGKSGSAGNKVRFVFDAR